MQVVCVTAFVDFKKESSK